MEHQEKQRSPSLMKTVVGGLLLLPMSLLLRLAERFMRTLSSNGNSQQSTSGLSMDSSSMPSSLTTQRSGSSLPIPPIQGLSEKDLIGSLLMKPPFSPETSGSNTYVPPFQTDKDGRYSCQPLEGTTGFMISTREGSLAIILNGILGNTPVQVRGTSGIT